VFITIYSFFCRRRAICCRIFLTSRVTILVAGRRDQTQTGVSGRQRGVAAADDYGGKGMKISPQQARLNIVREYERQHQEGVNALSVAIAKRQGSKTDAKAETLSDSKPSLASLLLAGGDE
jgi:hypothetical protein